MDIDIEQFHKIVDREIKKVATEDEVAYLSSSVATLSLWDDVLKNMYQETQRYLFEINQQMAQEKQWYLDAGADAKDLWFKRKVEIEEKKKGTLKFWSFLRLKRIEVKALLQSKREEENEINRQKKQLRLLGDGQETKELKKVRETRFKIRGGYNAALSHMAQLMQQYSAEEALDLLEQFSEFYVAPWSQLERGENSIDALLDAALKEIIEEENDASDR